VIRTNACLVEVIEVGTGTIYISLVEHYEIIDPDLPYEDRFRTLFHTLEINTDDRELLTLKVDREMVTSLGISLLSASREMPWSAPLSKSSEPSEPPSKPV
jgi:hypothetical protein